MQQNFMYNEQTFFNPVKKCLLTIYKSFVRPNLNYVDIIYNKTFNESLKEKL